MEDVWKDWKHSCKLLAGRLKNDPKSFILTAGAEFCAVKNPPKLGLAGLSAMAASTNALA